MQPFIESLPLDSVSRTVTVREMTAAEIRCLVLRGGRELVGEDRRFDLVLFTDLTADEVAALTDDEVGLLLSRAESVNAQFFGADGAYSGESGNPPPADPAGYVRGLEFAISRLIRCGHAMAWDYPWGLVVAAIDEAVQEA